MLIQAPQWHTTPGRETIGKSMDPMFGSIREDALNVMEHSEADQAKEPSSAGARDEAVMANNIYCGTNP